MVKPANVHDSQPFFKLFPYVADNFEMQYEAKFLAYSAHDSADISGMVRNKNRMKDVIAANGGGLEGISRKLTELGVIPYFEDYSTAWHKISKETCKCLRNRLLHGIRSYALRGFLLTA